MRRCLEAKHARLDRVVARHALGQLHANDDVGNEPDGPRCGGGADTESGQGNGWAQAGRKAAAQRASFQPMQHTDKETPRCNSAPRITLSRRAQLFCMCFVLSRSPLIELAQHDLRPAAQDARRLGDKEAARQPQTVTLTLPAAAAAATTTATAAATAAGAAGAAAAGAAGAAAAGCPGGNGFIQAAAVAAIAALGEPAPSNQAAKGLLLIEFQQPRHRRAPAVVVAARRMSGVSQEVR